MKIGVLLAATAPVAWGSSISVATAQHSPAQVITLWDQNGNFGAGVNSQNYESSMQAFDDAGADDFVVPVGETWHLREVDVTGAYVGGAGPATSVTISFWTDKHKQPWIEDASATVSCTDHTHSGSFKCRLPTYDKHKAVIKLRAGTWWISVVANCDSTVCGQWQWTENMTVQGHQAEWVNPGEGWGVCGGNWYRKYTLNYCFGGSPADLAFTLKGSITYRFPRFPGNSRSFLRPAAFAP